MSLRDHLIQAAERGHQPVFEPSGAAPLWDFDAIFRDSGLYGFDVNKLLQDDVLAPSYLMTAERVFEAGEEPEVFTVTWDPVTTGQDPLTGFHVGVDSAWVGSTPMKFMPADERTAGLLLLVETNFVHLSASREQDPPLIRGALAGPGEQFDYVILDRTRARLP